MANVGFSISLKEKNVRNGKYIHSVSSGLSGGDSVKSPKFFLEMVKGVLIETFASALDEEEGKGFDTQKAKLFVDGKSNKKISDVKPLGKLLIVQDADIFETLNFIYLSIINESSKNRRTGTYQNYNYVFIGGKLIAKNPQELRSYFKTNPELNNGDKIRFVNLTPYARRIEYQGINGNSRMGKASSRQVKMLSKFARRVVPKGSPINKPNGSYYLSYAKIKARGGTNTVLRSVAEKIKFEFVVGNEIGNIPRMGTGRNLAYKARTTFDPNGKYGQKGRGGRPYLYPSILLVYNEGNTISQNLTLQ